MTVQPFVYVLVFVAVFVAVEGVLLLLAGRRRSRKGPAARRLRALANRLQAPDLQADESLLRSSAPQQSLSARLYELLPGREALELRLYRAGISTSPLRFVAYSAALSMRFVDSAGGVPTGWWTRLAFVMPILLIVHIGINALFGNYGHVWKYASIDEAVRLFFGTMIAGLFLGV